MTSPSLLGGHPHLSSLWSHLPISPPRGHCPHRLLLSASLSWVPSNCPARGPSMLSSSCPAMAAQASLCPWCLLLGCLPKCCLHMTQRVFQDLLSAQEKKTSSPFQQRGPVLDTHQANPLENDGPPADQLFLTAACPGFPSEGRYTLRSSLIKGHLRHLGVIKHYWHLVGSYL